MAVIYLRSADGNDADTGLTWALAKATLASALTAAGAGGTVYVSDAHAEETAAAVTLTSPGTLASPVRVVCVDDTGNPEPPTARATTAVVANTGNFAITFAGCAYAYGVEVVRRGTNSAAISFINTSPWWWHFDTCVLALDTTSAGAQIQVNPSATSIESLLQLTSTTLRFAATGQSVVLGVRMVWQGGSLASGTVPTALFTGFTRAPQLDVVGVDLSAAGTGKSLVTVGGANGRIRLVDCKLGSAVSIVTGTPDGPGGEIVEVVNCDSADTNYRYYRDTYQAVETHETTIVRTGGATDGTTPISRKIVTTASVTAHAPYLSQPVEFWNETVGSTVTVTIPTVTDNVTLTDAEAWVEVEYLGTSGFPLGLFTSDRVVDPVFGTPANQASNSDAWTTTGLTTPIKQQLSVTFTPQEKGIIRARVVLAKASTTVYYDPLILASSGRQYQSTVAYLNEGVSGAVSIPMSSGPSIVIGRGISGY